MKIEINWFIETKNNNRISGTAQMENFEEFETLIKNLSNTLKVIE